MTDEYQKVSQEIEKANDIVIVGGGATGVELAGEICDKYKMKKLTLIHSRQILGAKYFFFSSRSLKMREKYISFPQFIYSLREVCLH